MGNPVRAYYWHLRKQRGLSDAGARRRVKKKFPKVR